MKREQFDIARCTVERLMRDIGIEGVRRGKKVKTTHGQPAEVCPLDKVNRQFRASQPNQLWVSDFTFVSTWRGLAVPICAEASTIIRRIKLGPTCKVAEETRINFVLTKPMSNCELTAAPTWIFRPKFLIYA